MFCVSADVDCVLLVGFIDDFFRHNTVLTVEEYRVLVDMCMVKRGGFFER